MEDDDLKEALKQARNFGELLKATQAMHDYRMLALAYGLVDSVLSVYEHNESVDLVNLGQYLDLMNALQYVLYKDDFSDEVYDDIHSYVLECIRYSTDSLELMLAWSLAYAFGDDPSGKAKSVVQISKIREEVINAYWTIRRVMGSEWDDEDHLVHLKLSILTATGWETVTWEDGDYLNEFPHRNKEYSR